LTITRGRRAWTELTALLLVALLVRVPLLPLHAYRSGGGTDTSEYKGWMQALHEHGLLNIFRESNTDYIGYQWVLWILTLIWSPFGDSYSDTAPGLHLLIKAPPLLFEGGLIVAVYLATRMLMEQSPGRKEPHGNSTSPLPLIAAAIIAFHPASLYDAAVWGQIDAMTALVIAAAVLLIYRKMPVAAGFVWGVGFVMKPQPIVVAPLLAVLVFDRGNWKELLRLSGGGLAAGLLVAMPWILHGDLRRIGGIYEALVKEDMGRLSGNSWNIWWFFDLAGDARPGDRPLGGVPLTYRMTGTALTGLGTLLALAFAWKRPSLERALIAAAYSVFVFYMVSTSSHDRYLYPFFALLLPVLMLDRRWLWAYVPLSVTFTTSLILSAPPSEGWGHNWLESPLSLAGAALNVVIFGALTALLFRGCSDAFSRDRTSSRTCFDSSRGEPSAFR
jgi:hypothetical protein